MSYLRDYQKKVIRDIYTAIRGKHRRILLVAPTGAGKTIISSRIVLDAISKGKRVMLVVHHDNLVQQTADKFHSFGIRCGFIKSGYPEDMAARVQIASVQSMATLYAFQPKCPECGYHFEVKRYTVQLKLKHCLRPEDLPKLEKYRQLLKEAYFNYFAPTWAASRFKEEYGYFPPFDWAKHAVFGNTFSEVHVKNYHQHLSKIAQRLSQDKKWIDRYMNLEFGKDDSFWASQLSA